MNFSLKQLFIAVLLLVILFTPSFIRDIVVLQDLWYHIPRNDLNSSVLDEKHYINMLKIMITLLCQQQHMYMSIKSSIKSTICCAGEKKTIIFDKFPEFILNVYDFCNMSSMASPSLKAKMAGIANHRHL